MPSRPIFLPGLNGDPRNFRELLRHFPTAEVVSWIAPLRRESISNYASRIAEPLGDLRGATLVGVSFGGIIAQEIAQAQQAKACIIVSSIRDPSELPPLYRLGRFAARLPIESFIASAEVAATLLPSSLHHRSSTKLAPQKGKRAAWRRWAIGAVLRWKPLNSSALKLLQIHGDRDTTFPVRHLRPDLTIQGGGHLIALTHAETIANFIAKSMN